MKPIIVDLSKTSISGGLENSIMLSDVTTSNKAINTSTLNLDGACLKFTNKAIDVFKLIAQAKTFFYGQKVVCNSKEIQLITIYQNKNSAFLFETFKKLGISTGALTIGIDWKLQTIYLSQKLIRDLNKFSMDTVKLLTMYLISLHKLLYNLCTTKEVFTYEQFATSVAVPESFFNNTEDYIYLFNKDVNTWSLEELDLNNITAFENLENAYAKMTIIEDANKLMGNFTVLKNTIVDDATVPINLYHLIFTYGTLATNPTYYIINNFEIISNSELCVFDISNDSLLSKLNSLVQYKAETADYRIKVNPDYLKNAMGTYSIESIEEIEDTVVRESFEKIYKYLTERGASDSIGTKQLEEILGIKITANKNVLDYDNVKSFYDNDEYAQNLYTKVKDYYNNFNLKDLTSTLKGFVKGDIYSMIFVGESGTGKSTAARVVPTKCGFPYDIINCSTNIEEADIIGTMIPNVDKKSETDPEFKWQDGILTKAVRNGYTIIFEEINFAKPGILGKLNSLLDEARQIDLPTGEVVTAHPNFRLIGTCNIAYEGTNRMNKAFINRFEIVKEFSDLNRDEVITIINERLGYSDRSKIEIAYNVYEAIKKFSKEQNLDIVISIRQMLTLFSAGKYFKNAKEAIINIIINGAFLEENDYKKYFLETVLDGFDLNFKI